MTATPAHSPRPPRSSEWVFPWRPLGSPLLPKFIALAFAATFFTVLVTTLRVQVNLPEKVSPRKASLIYLGDDPQSRALAQRAQEGGPFPSRFQLSDWPSLAETERQAMNAARYQPPAYHPVMHDLPEENLVPPLFLAPRGKVFFPERKAPAVSTVPAVTDQSLTPRLYPLSESAVAAIPESLPPFPAPVDSVMTSASWRFLICLSPSGTVSQCVSLEKGGEAAAATVVAWLRQVDFPPAKDLKDRWISLAVGFTHPRDDGPDAR